MIKRAAIIRRQPARSSRYQQLPLTFCKRTLLTDRISTMASAITLNDGRTIPWLGFGTGTALYGKDATNLVTQAITSGLTHLDGAQMYRNEDTLGAAIKASGKPRSELFITTKLNTTPGLEVKASLQESLQKLQVDHVDLFLIHSPHPANEQGLLQGLWKQMEEVQAAGLATSIGVSNFRVQDLEDILKIAKVVPAVNQVGVTYNRYSCPRCVRA